jgi:hypothetical protein
LKGGLVLGAIIPNGFDRAIGHGPGAQGFFLLVLWLFVDERIAAILITFEIVRGRFAAQVAVDALGITVIFSRDVIFVFVFFGSHKQEYVAGETREESPINQAAFGCIYLLEDSLLPSNFE